MPPVEGTTYRTCTGVGVGCPRLLPPAQCVKHAGAVCAQTSPSARAVRMAPEADPRAGDTHGPGDGCFVCCDVNAGLVQECSHPHDTPARALQRPQPDRRETSLRAADGVYHAVSPTRSGELARTLPQPRTQLPHRAQNPCIHCHPPPDSARLSQTPQQTARAWGVCLRTNEAHWTGSGRRRRTAATCLFEARPSDG